MKKLKEIIGSLLVLAGIGFIVVEILQLGTMYR